MSRIAIAKPNAGSVRTSAISRLKPGFGFRTATVASIKPATNENNVRGAAQVSHIQRNTFLRRLNAETKYVSSDADSNQTTIKPPPLSTLPNGRTMSAETKTNTIDRPLNVTETISSKSDDINSETVVVASSAIDRCLTRSGTFVCEPSDETQAKLLSLTHNINSPTTTVPNEANQNTSKERTNKRSLSPIYGELMNMAKRKSTQLSNQMGVVTSTGPSLISTPRGGISEQNIPLFTARNTLANFTELENTMMFMDQSHAMSSTAMQSTHLIDVVRTSHANNVNAENSGKMSKNLTKLLYVTEASVDGVKCDNDNETMVVAVAAQEGDAIANEEIVLVETTRTHSGK